MHSKNKAQILLKTYLFKIVATVQKMHQKPVWNQLKNPMLKKTLDAKILQKKLIILWYIIIPKTVQMLALKKKPYNSILDIINKQSI